jgi:hypothetical protein
MLKHLLYGFALQEIKHTYISGHEPQNPDGSVAGPFGKVGTNDVSVKQGYESAVLLIRLVSAYARLLTDSQDNSHCSYSGSSVKQVYKHA